MGRVGQMRRRVKKELNSSHQKQKKPVGGEIIVPGNDLRLQVSMKKAAM